MDFQCNNSFTQADRSTFERTKNGKNESVLNSVLKAICNIKK